MALPATLTLALAATLVLGAAAAQAAPPRPAGPEAAPAGQPREYRARKFRGGQGASWKTGRDAYGFMGSYGGCRYRGHAGPNGYRLDRMC